MRTGDAAYQRAWRRKNPMYTREYYKKTIKKLGRANYNKLSRLKNRRWQRENPRRCLAHRLKYRYGITPADRKIIYTRQRGRCAICRRRRKLIVDHCHRRGNVRGLLCYSCNMGLGAFQDSVTELRAAIRYLQKSRS